MSAKTDEYEFIKKHWGLEEKAFGQAPRVGWGDIVGIVEAARAAGREEEQEELSKAKGNARELLRAIVEEAKKEGAEEQRERSKDILRGLYRRDLRDFFGGNPINLVFKDGWQTAIDYAEQAIREQGEGEK